MRLSADALQRLAADYVLGTLRGRARARFERHLRERPEARELVARWEAALTPLARRVPPLEPPARVWRGIEARLAPPAVAASPGFWRSLALLSGGVASVLVAAFLWLSSGPRGEPLFVAVLTEANASPRMVLSMHQPDLLRVRMVKPWAGMQKQSLELWAMQGDGVPRSLGLVRNEMVDTMMRIDPRDPRLVGAKAFAITMEPEGGSPTRQPTGSIVCSGPVAPMRRG